MKLTLASIGFGICSKDTYNEVNDDDGAGGGGSSGDADDNGDGSADTVNNISDVYRDNGKENDVYNNSDDEGDIMTT